jgi:hypothetical protein
MEVIIMTRRKIGKPYEVPLKVETRVRHDGDDLAQRLAQATGTGCPFNGTYVLERSVPLSDYRDPDGVHGRGHGIVEDNVNGCVALRDPVCYLNLPRNWRGRSHRPKPTCSEECPVYQRVVELLE